MNTFVKNMIKGVLSVGTLFIVGKVCYEVGRNVGDLERQLENIKAVDGLSKAVDIDNMVGDVNDNGTAVVHHLEKIEAEKTTDKEPQTPSVITKICNAKMFLSARKLFSKRDRPKGILGSLLTNPDGAKIEAIVKDGGVQISVKPRAA